jgi:hypothetical protein
VFHVPGVPFALGAAHLAGGGAGLKLAANEVPVGLRLAGQDSSRRIAHVRAVQVKANALHHFLDVLLAEAGISATCATLRATKTLFDAVDESGHIDLRLAWVSSEHVLNVIHYDSFHSLFAVYVFDE